MTENNSATNEGTVAETNPTISSVRSQPLPIDAPEPECDAVDDLTTMTFRQACSSFLESRKPFLHPRTYRDYRYCVKWLAEFFGTKRLPEITADHIRKYQRFRSERCGPHMINHETSILQQMLRRIGTWERVGLGFQPLSLPKTGPGRCISDEEERRLIRAGASNPRWETVYMFALLSLNTTMGPGEVMHLRRKI
jgi:hypothetical protein